MRRFLVLSVLMGVAVLLVPSVTRSQNPEWMVFNTDNSGLPSNDVRDIEVDAQGTAWIGTPEGLAEFDGDSWTVYTFDNSGLPGSYIEQVAFDVQENLWVAHHPPNMAMFDGENWTEHGDAVPQNPMNLTSMESDAQGNIWVGINGIGLALPLYAL